MKNMKDMMEKMMMSPEKKGQMDKNQIQAKMEVLKELLDLAHGEMGKKVKSGMDEMKKVSVIAPDDESLAEGLELAGDIVPTLKEETDESDPQDSPDGALDPREDEKAEEKADSNSEDDEEDDSMFNRKMKKGIY